MNVVRVDLRNSPMLVKISLLDESYHKNSSAPSPSLSCNLNPCSPSTNKSYPTRCSYSLSQHVSPQSPSASQNLMSISPKSRLHVNSVSHFLQPTSPANTIHGNDEEALQRQVEMQALQNLELREQLQREKTRTHLVISQNLSMKQQLDSAQKKLKEIESLQFLRKSACPSTPNKAPSSNQLTSSSKFRVEKTIQKTLRKSTNLFKGDLSQSFTTSKRSTQCMNQQQLNDSKNFRDYQVSCINQNKNYQLQENNYYASNINNNQDSNSCNNWAQQQLPQQQAHRFGLNALDNSQNNSILDILNCLKDEQQEAQQCMESLGESFLKDLHNTQFRPSTKLAAQNQRTSQLISKPRSRKGLTQIQPYIQKIRI